jgi:beta-lactamase superfamily II metal-dependent hydrolase
MERPSELHRGDSRAGSVMQPPDEVIPKMVEIDFLPVGDGERSGDAIALRYSHPDTGAPVVGVIDAGFEDDGEAIVEHVNTYYGTDTADFVLVTHPDADHINGAGKVVRGLNVRTLLIHRPSQHGYPENSGAEPADELAELAQRRGAKVIEPFQGLTGFGSLMIAGPTSTYYRALLAEQQETAQRESVRKSFAERYFGGGGTVLAALRKALDVFPAEIFFDDAGGTNPRNNSAAIVSLVIDGRHFLLPSDAGVPAIGQALDYLDEMGRARSPLDLFVLPHHGSRHNLDQATITRILGDPTSAKRGTAVASVSEKSPDYPSPRVANAAGRRGYPVFTTKGKTLLHSHNAPPRPNWTAATPLPPLAEDDHDD